MIFHTIIMNSSFAGKTVSDNLRYIEWTRGNPNPHILTSGYFEKIIAGHYHFARKFDTEVDTTILDMLDAHRAKTLTGWVGPDRVRMHPQAGHSLDQTGNQ
jgi:hypothetical protein